MTRLQRQQQFERMSIWLDDFHRESPVLFDFMSLGIALVVYAAVCALASL